MPTQVEVQTADPLKLRTEKRVLYHRHVGLNFQGSMFASVHDVATFHHHYVAFPLLFMTALIFTVTVIIASCTSPSLPLCPL